MTQSLTTRIILYFVLLTTMVLVLVGTLSYRSGSDSLKDAAISEMLVTAIEKEAALDAWIEERLADLGQIANEGDLAERMSVFSAATADSDARQRAHGLMLKELKPHIGAGMLELFVIDTKTGKVLISTSPSEEGKLKKGHPYFDQGRKELYLQPTYQSADLGEPAMTAAMPLRATNGNRIAVLAARLNLATFNTIVQRRTGLRRSEDVFLINSEQYPITQPRFADEPVVLHRKLDTEAVRRCAARNSGVILAPDYRGVDSITLYRWNAKHKFGLIVKIDTSEALEPTRIFGWSVLLISSLALFLAGGFAFMLAGTITQPLRALQAGVRRAAEGSFQQALPVSTVDEIGALANDFNIMSARVVERSAELARVNENLHLENTERKRVEIELRLFRAILDYSSDGVYVTDPVSAHFLDVNESAAQRLGYTRAELLALTVLDVTADFDRAMFEESIMLARTYKHVTLEATMRCKDGSTFPAEVSVSQVMLDREYALAVVRDITLRKQLEQQALLSAAALSSIAEAVLIVNADNKIVYVNQAFVTVSGYEVEEALGRTPAFLQSGRQDKAFYTDMWRQLIATDHWQGEVWDKHKNGDIYPILLSLSAIRDNTGAVTHYVGVQSDISALKRYENQLTHQANHDALTQLPNRNLFGTHLEAALARARRSEKKLALLFLDLDRFKMVNDTLGHGTGDELLRGVSERLQQCIRQTDMVARLGGDEFVILLDILESRQAAGQVAQKILREFSAAFNIDGQELFISMSIGISIFPEDGDDLHTLFKNADSAMYTAKSAGRNTYFFFSSSDRDGQALDRFQLSNDLRHAIARGEIYLLYQPRFNLKTGAVQGMEALARWRHPTRGLIPPAFFIGIAEQSGQMEEIGAWVLRAACRQIRDWGDAHLVPLRVAVNLSALQFNRSDLPKQIAAILDEYRIDPSLLELEITESVVMTDAPRAIQALTELNDMGLLIAIDDFGTGYSSLSYLKRFPISYLKIDQSFVGGVCENPDDAAIIRAIIAMGKSLGLQLIAEGVETEEQRVFLVQEECDEAQGFLFSHPLPPADVAALLEKSDRPAAKRNSGRVE